MLVKLVYEDRITIFSGIDSISVLCEEKKDKVLSVVFKDEKPKLNFVLCAFEDNSYKDVCSAFLMNEKGETIERLN